METIQTTAARRLALARAGLLKPEWTGFPSRADGRSGLALRAALKVIERFGYLQLDTVAVAGARSHAIALLSRLEGLDPALAEELLKPGEPLFEYWGHEASWIPLDLYPIFAFRRREYSHHPWWGDVVGQHPKAARDLLSRIREEGPLRSLDMEGTGSRGWWDLKLVKRVATSLWSSGELAVRARHNFQRVYDLAERVIPEDQRRQVVPETDALDRLLELALQGHGWATKGTLTRTWRLRNRKQEIKESLRRLEEQGRVVPCALVGDGDRQRPGWIRPEDLELAARLKRVRPRRDRGVLLSPFDPLLWDRDRVRQLFDFDQVLEIFKPKAERVYGYYCLPVLSGDRLVARFDLKADRKTGRLNVVAHSLDYLGRLRHTESEAREAARTALNRYAAALGLEVAGWDGR